MYVLTSNACNNSDLPFLAYVFGGFFGQIKHRYVLREAQELCEALKISQGLLYNFIFILGRNCKILNECFFIIWRRINLFWFYFIM